MQEEKRDRDECWTDQEIVFPRGRKDRAMNKRQTEQDIRVAGSSSPRVYGRESIFYRSFRSSRIAWLQVDVSFAVLERICSSKRSW